MFTPCLKLMNLVTAWIGKKEMLSEQLDDLLDARLNLVRTGKP